MCDLDEVGKVKSLILLNFIKISHEVGKVGKEVANLLSHGFRQPRQPLFDLVNPIDGLQN